jgi:hypothetical protein
MSRRFLPVTSVIVALTIFFYTVCIEYIPQVPSVPGFRLVLGMFASVGFYVAVFKASLWVYNEYLRDMLEKREAITGEWFYKLQIKGKEHLPRYGICKIARHDEELSANGIHYAPEVKKFTSRFTSDHAIIDGNNLIIMYTSVGVDEDIFMRRGVYFLSTEGFPPNRIYGIWTDVVPNTNIGDIIMQRCDKNTDKILADMEFPIGTSELKPIVASASHPASAIKPKLS